MRLTAIRRISALAGAAVVAAAAATGCTMNQSDSQPLETTQRFEVIDSNKVSAEEASNYILAHAELYETRSELVDGQYDGPNNHPAFSGNGNAGVTNSALVIRKGESLLSAARRIKAMTQYKRLIFDLSEDAIAADKAVASTMIKTRGGATVFGEVAAIYDDQIPGVEMYTAKDGKHHSLVVSDRRYHRWSPLAVFEVESGTLKANAMRLSSALGWSLNAESWKAKNYRVESGYPIVIPPSDARKSLSALLSRHPVQARLNQNNNSVVVVPRPQPIVNR